MCGLTIEDKILLNMNLIVQRWLRKEKYYVLMSLNVCVKAVKEYFFAPIEYE
jgi:hypothetical protein